MGGKANSLVASLGRVQTWLYNAEQNRRYIVRQNRNSRHVEAVAAESLDSGAVLWSERSQGVLGHVVGVDEVDNGDRVRIHWRHSVNDTQSSVSSQIVSRDSLIPVLCGV